MHINKYIKTIESAMRGKTNGGLIYMFPVIILKIAYLVPLMFIWKIITSNGIDAGMGLGQLLSYTYVNAILSDMLVVRTFMTDWNYESKSTALFTHPVPLFGQVIARTIGAWIPAFVLFTLPMAFVAPLLGIQIMPVTLLAFPSLILCISLGFAFEFIFFCLSLKVRNVFWVVLVIRSAIVAIFSGTVIPFKILPFGLDKWIGFQPFGSLGGATLAIYIGTAEPAGTILVQLFWNVIMWAVAIAWFNKSRERMSGLGG
jgi:ABC-2 type transport system permease protein